MVSDLKTSDYPIYPLGQNTLDFWLTDLERFVMILWKN